MTKSERIELSLDVRESKQWLHEEGTYKLWPIMCDFLQNAIDSHADGYKMSISSSNDGRDWSIVNYGASLSRLNLLNGGTTKQNNERIGRRGTGMKLAAQHAIIAGAKVTITTRINDQHGQYKWSEMWEFTNQWSNTFECDIIVVNSTVIDKEAPGVSIDIVGLPYDMRSVIDERAIIDEKRDLESNCVLRDEKYAGKLFVGGLYVCNIGTIYGYDISPRYVTLDHDRKQVACIADLHDNIYYIHMNEKVHEMDAKVLVSNKKFFDQNAKRISDALHIELSSICKKITLNVSSCLFDEYYSDVKSTAAYKIIDEHIKNVWEQSDRDKCAVVANVDEQKYATSYGYSAKIINDVDVFRLCTVFGVNSYNTIVKIVNRKLASSFIPNEELTNDELTNLTKSTKVVIDAIDTLKFEVNKDGYHEALQMKLFDVSTYCVKIANSINMHNNSMGICDYNSKIIRLNKNILNSEALTVSTLVHEYAHALTFSNDYTRQHTEMLQRIWEIIYMLKNY